MTEWLVVHMLEGRKILPFKHRNFHQPATYQDNYSKTTCSKGGKFCPSNIVIFTNQLHIRTLQKKTCSKGEKFYPSSIFHIHKPYDALLQYRDDFLHPGAARSFDQNGGTGEMQFGQMLSQLVRSRKELHPAQFK